MGVLLARVPYVTCLGIPRYCDQVSYNATLAGIAKTRRTPLNPGWVVAFFLWRGRLLDCYHVRRSGVHVEWGNKKKQKGRQTRAERPLTTLESSVLSVPRYSVE